MQSVYRCMPQQLGTNASNMNSRITRGKGASGAPVHPKVVDLQRFAPAYITWISNKLSRGASRYYLQEFGIGIETWRCMALLAYQKAATAQQASKVIGMDKASISRCFKNLLDTNLIEMDSDPTDGRLKIARLTRKGRELHDSIVGVALERERAFMSVLSPAERDVFVDLLQRLHENLPQVEIATSAYLARHVHGAADGRAGKKRRSTAAAGE